MGRRSTTRAGAQSPDEDWLELLFEFGLGTGDGGPWRRLLGERQDSPRKMLEDLLIAAAGHGLTDRVRRLLARGVDPEGREIKHPIYQGRSPVQEAALNGHMDIVSLLVDAGASWEHDQVDELIATAMSGDRAAVERLLAADPGLRERAIERCPDQLVRAAEQDSYEAVALLIELGFDVNARSRTAPLHEAAMRGNLAVIRLLLDHGADPNIRDTGYDATPAGWAEHHGQREAQQLLEALEQPGPPRRATERTAQSRATQPGAAMRTVAAAFTAVSEGRFDELGSMLAAEHRLAGPPRRGRPDPPLPWTRRKRSNGCGSACSPTARCRSARSSRKATASSRTCTASVTTSSGRRSGSWSPRSTTGRSPTCAATRPNPRHTTRCTPVPGVDRPLRDCRDRGSR